MFYRIVIITIISRVQRVSGTSIECHHDSLLLHHTVGRQINLIVICIRVRLRTQLCKLSITLNNKISHC